ncbi:UNVERIFIED_CONTAM: hypothetical protein FKN15_052113 [Acipenser sinensis]
MPELWSPEAKGVFILESEHLNRCIRADKTKLTLENCDQPSKHMLWKWVSRHRLFNIGSSMCLGLNTTSLQQPLNMFKCDSTLKTLWWRCSGNTLFGAAQLKLTGKGRLVVATKQRVSSQRWKIYLTSGEGPCAHPYEEIHTVQGNAHGMPCVLPFKYNNKWYSECTTEGREDNYRWCATTSLYDQDEKWGFCPNPGLSPMSALASTHCGVFNSAVGNEWQNLDCGSGLPFICKKYPNFTRRAEPFDTWQYYPTVCSPGWFPHNKFCYKLQSQEQSWKDSLTACRSSNADLISVHSLADVALLFTLFQNVSETVSGAWIGLTNKTQGSFEWSDGSPVTFTYWHKYEPNVTYVEGPLCVRVTTDSTWQVKMCDERLPSVCKKPGNLEEQKSGLGDKGCSEVFHSEKVLMKRSWEDADFFCQALGSNLVSFSHYEEEIFLNGILQNMFDSSEERLFWAGFNKRNPLSGAAWEWSDGTAVVSSFIEDRNNEDDQRNCAAYKAGNMIIPLRCDVKLEWICKMPKENEPWVFYRGSEYLFHNVSFPWNAVAFACKMSGADLVSIHSSDQLDFIQSRIEKLFQNEVKWWIGLFAEYSNTELRWIDGSAVDYEKWEGTNSRRSEVKNERCVYMSSQTGRWSEGKCNGHHPYICERKTVSVVEIPREPHLIGGCPERWLYFGHKWRCAQNFLFSASQYRLSATSGSVTASLNSNDTWTKDNSADSICHQPYEGSNIADTKMSSGCPKSNGLSNWIQYKDHCYAFDISFYNYSVFTMEEAKAFCQTLDPSSHLLTIQDVDENAFVLNQVKKNPLITGRVWLGITLDSKDHPVSWIDGSSISFSNWEKNTDKEKSKVGCAVLVSASGTWTYVSCNHSRNRLVCKAPNVPSADVVSINSEAENSFLTDYSHRIWNGTKDVWLGMSFNVDTDSLKWFDGLDVVYTNWMHDAYSEDTPADMCAILHTGSGKWEKVSCDEVSEKAVVCETPMSKFHFLISFAKLLHLMLWKFQKHSKNYTYITIRAVFLP